MTTRTSQYSAAKTNWFPLGLKSLKELSLDKTLRCGQSFRWKKVVIPSSEESKDECWIGPIGSTVFGLKQQSEDVYYTVFSHTQDDSSKIENEATRESLRDYLRLDISLESLYNGWCSADKRFQDSSTSFVGIRLLRQPPVECLFSFICSQNNNIGRITKMIDALCEQYGTFLCKVDDRSFYTFPTLEGLAAIEEQALRTLGFGYRARYIVTAASEVIERGGETWLHSLRGVSDKKEVQKELVALMGIGKKVADCVSLFALDQLECIPVDTHVWQIAQMYMPKLKGKKLNDQFYEEIGEFFKQKFSPYCGWAHSVLFAADLNFFKKELEQQSQGAVVLVESKEKTAKAIVLSAKRKSLEQKYSSRSKLEVSSDESSSSSSSEADEYVPKKRSISQRRRK